MKILGVDPGGSGALALLDGPRLVAVEDMPVFMVRRGKSDKPEIDVHGLIALLRDWEPECCWFERVGGWDGQSAPAAHDGALSWPGRLFAKPLRASLCRLGA